MAKADLTRDYYADLELSPSATEAEIKKQFRQLALKYHPDRNPGRESDVNAKFQTIQSAHEILTDPEQRAKYDNGRRVGSGGFASSRPQSGYGKGNPWANAGAQWTPPPRRTAAPSAGAQRYANYAKANASARPSGQEGAEARQKMYEGWERMRPTESKAPPPETPRRKVYDDPPTFGSRTRPTQPPPPFANTRPPPIPKRNGYVPGNSAGDEPPAANTSSYNTSRTRAPTARQDAYAEAQYTQQLKDPLKQFREKAGVPFETRIRTPYATHGGEKTDPFESVNINRPDSRRNSQKTDSSERHRSASPPRPTRQPHLEPELDSKARAGSDTNLGSPPKRTFSTSTRTTKNGEKPGWWKPPTTNLDTSSSGTDDDPRRPFGAKERRYAKPRAARQDSSRFKTYPQGTPKPTASTFFSAQDGAAGEKSAPSMYAPGDSYRHPTSPPFLSKVAFKKASSEAYAEHINKWARSTPPKKPGDELSEGLDTPLGSLNAFERKQFNLLDQLLKKNAGDSVEIPFQTQDSTPSCQREIPELTVCGAPKFGVPSIPFHPFSSHTSVEASAIRNGLRNGDDRFLSSGHRAPYAFPTPIPSDRKANGIKPRFTFDPNSIPKTVNNNSTENISTTFTPEDWHGKFQAGDDYFGKDTTAAPSRGSSGSRTRNRSPPKPRRPQVNTQERHANVEPTATGQPQTAEPLSASPAGAKFTAEEWNETFKPQVFAPPPHPSPGPSRTYSINTTRRTRVSPPDSKTNPMAASVDDDDDDNDDEDEPLHMGTRPIPKSGSDAPSPFATDYPNAMDIDPPLVNEARKVNVEPSRPEWRAGDGNGISPPLATPTPQARPSSSHSNGTNPSLAKGRVVSDNLAANFADLKNVEPLYQPATGLNSFADLGSKLPFESKAAPSIPISRNVGNLSLPPPPKGPSPPTIEHNAPRPSPTSWASYMASFKAYMAEWDKFNTKMLNHFGARKAETDALPRGWMNAFGGSEITKYFEGLKEDEKVREWWDVACQKHRKAVEDFIWAKEVFKSGIKVVGSRENMNGGMNGKLFGEIA